MYSMDMCELIGRTAMLAGVIAMGGAAFTASVSLGAIGLALYACSTFLF